MSAWALFAVSAAAQRADGPAVAQPVPAPTCTARRAWLPYLAPACSFGPLIYAEFHGSTFDRASLAIGAAVASLLVFARQVVAAHDFVAVQLELDHALHDPLTGLPSRALVLDRAEQVLARARRRGLPAVALFVDVDGLKQVNDAFGHAAGDAVLRAVGTRLAGVLRAGDTAGRLGGDEFVVLLEADHAAVDADGLADQILEAVNEPVEIDRAGRPRMLSVSVSIGVASGCDVTVAELLHAADDALYRAKSAGRSRIAA